MYKNILTGFIIGSSFPVFLLFFLGFARLKKYIDKENCFYNIFGDNMDIYFVYTIIAPLYLGIMSACAVAIHEFTKLPIIYSFLITHIASALFISILITKCDIYEYNFKKLNQQYFNIIISHIIAYSIVVIIYKSIK